MKASLDARRLAAAACLPDRVAPATTRHTRIGAVALARDSFKSPPPRADQ